MPMLKEQNADFIPIPRETFKCMINDFEHLLEDFESISEVETMKIAEKRLKEFREGKIKPVGEKEFRELMRSEGVE